MKNKPEETEEEQEQEETEMTEEGMDTIENLKLLSAAIEMMLSSHDNMLDEFEGDVDKVIAHAKLKDIMAKEFASKFADKLFDQMDAGELKPNDVVYVITHTLNELAQKLVYMISQDSEDFKKQISELNEALSDRISKEVGQHTMAEMHMRHEFDEAVGRAIAEGKIQLQGVDPSEEEVDEDGNVIKKKKKSDPMYQ